MGIHANSFNNNKLYTIQCCMNLLFVDCIPMRLKTAMTVRNIETRKMDAKTFIKLCFYAI